uniref:Nephronophthisis 1 n=1 Tax=Astyanax mexicanus TaxID=7994 RepID=A0A8B9LBH8_ASTMX
MTKISMSDGVSLFFCHSLFLSLCVQAEESAPIGNYEQLKRDEEERLRAQQDRLKALAQKLQPEDNSTEGEEDSAEEDSEEEDESQEEDEEDDVHNDKTKEDAADDEVDETAQNYTARKGIRTYVALSDFTGEEEGDLTVQKGAVLRVLQKNEDGWWLAQDAKGNKGLVPRNYLKVRSQQNETNSRIGAFIIKTLQNWDTIRRAVTEIDATDVLSAMGAIPPGFRTSTLSRLLEEGTSYRASHYIQPRLSQSELCFKDLQMDPDTGKVHSRSSRVCLTVTLWSCRMIPPPGVGLQVLSRHIRFCAFNGTEVLSNIHTVRATYNPTSPKTWSFSPRMSNMLPCLLDGDCFIRCDSDSPELGILFELGITYIRNSTGERGDLSCGWAFLKLFDENGALIPLRTYELTVHGGTPYEAEADADATSTKRGQINFCTLLVINDRVVESLPALCLSQGRLQKSQDTNSQCSCKINWSPPTDREGHSLLYHKYKLLSCPATDFPVLHNLISFFFFSGTSTGVLQQMLLSRKLPKLILKLKPPKTRVREQLKYVDQQIILGSVMANLL